MALQKHPLNISFQKGVETKTDPFQLPMDSFALLHNSEFTTVGRLTKRNGFSNITTLPITAQTNITTLNDNLVTTGSNLYAYNKDNEVWINKGITQPVQLSTRAVTRTSTAQTGADSAVATNGLLCAVYMDSSDSYYQISDASTGQQILARVELEATATNPRAFTVGNYFIVTYMATLGSTPTLRYVAIPIFNPAAPIVPATIDSSVSAITDGYDGYSANNTLFLAWSGSSTSVRVGFLTATLIVAPPAIITTSSVSSLVSVTVDTTALRVYVTYYGGTTGRSASFTYNLGPVMTSTTTISQANLSTLTSLYLSGNLNIFYEIVNSVAQLNNTDQNYLQKTTIAPSATTGAGTPGSTSVMLRSVGLASKAFQQNGLIYMLAAYGQASSSNQPSYFLIDENGVVYMRLAYANGGGYESSQVLPNVSVLNGTYLIPYLYKDFLTSVNKTTSSALPSAAIYTQTGVNLAEFTINNSQQYSSEIAGSLHLTGGQLWQYDGVLPVEHNFQVWPEDTTATIATTGGFITSQPYFYQFTYEWTDAAGNIHRSAPSIPLGVTTVTGSTNAITLFVPTLRLTSKLTPNSVRIVGYRWSAAQQSYYQFTSVTSPTLNDTTVDYVTITDTQSDSQILGNALIYTTGGVVEDIAAPASVASTLFNNRLWLVDAEDRNLLWFSKQVIEGTPVEMSDLFTFYVAPTSGAQGSTGDITALAPMDDKLIIFKKDAIYYINGIGPDNTGANSQYSDPIFITSAVGCSNPNSIVLTPNGLMFQSDKGIWLLGRDLGTTYIGSPVEAYNGYTVQSAQSIPTTNQVRFILTNNLTLMYDYFVQQWGTHSNIQAISGTLYQSYQTYLNSFGQVYQETPGQFTDGATPVLMSFTTAWINLSGLQGFERFYFGHLLGTYYTPFKLNVGIAYNYNPSPAQSILVTPDNFVSNWGGEAQWGSGSNWGGGQGDGASSDTSANVFAVRLFPNQQKCMSFQMTITEIYDSSLGVSPGEGLSLSGLNLMIGAKRGFRTNRASTSFG